MVEGAGRSVSPVAAFFSGAPPSKGEAGLFSLTAERTSQLALIKFCSCLARIMAFQSSKQRMPSRQGQVVHPFRSESNMRGNNENSPCDIDNLLLCASCVVWFQPVSALKDRGDHGLRHADQGLQSCLQVSEITEGRLTRFKGGDLIERTTLAQSPYRPAMAAACMRYL